MIFLETERLILRNLEEKDFTIMYEYRNDLRCSKYQRNQIKDKDSLLKFIKEKKEVKISLEKVSIFAISLKETDEMIGEVVVVPKENIILMGYTISYKYHRKGFAFELLSTFIEFLHDRYPDKEFICLVDPKNIASIKLLKKLGYEHIRYEEENNCEVYGKWIVDKNKLIIF